MKADMFNEKNIAHTYIIAEAGLNHNGSVEIAKQLIDLAIKAGADAVKFQKRTVEKLAVKATLDAPDDRFPEFGTTYREIREHLEFNMSQYQEIKKYAEGKGLDFLCTAFDTEAADFLEELGIKIYKLASHSATNIELLEYLAKTGKKSILSTGMADIDEIETAVQIFEKYKTPLLLLHCVSSYPTPLDECNLNMINVLKENFNLPVGYSGHELGYLPTLTAVSMGAVAIERHYTLDNNMIGFDHKMSLSSEDFIETEWFQNANIVVDNNVVGQIEVFYTQFIRELNNSQFLPQEQKLINTIAEKTSNYIFYRKLARTVEYLKEQETIVKNDNPSTEILTASQDEHWNWRLNIAKKIASHIIKDTYDIINLYVIESTNQANAGPASSIDFIIHVKEGSSKIELLKIWFDGWGLCLDEINYQRTGHIANRSLLDLHFVTDKDIEANERYASMINAVDNSEFAIRKLI